MKIARIIGFSDDSLSYRDDETRSDEIDSVIKTDKKISLEDVVVGDYYIDNSGNRVKLKEVNLYSGSINDYILELEDGTTSTISADPKGLTRFLNKENFSTRDDRTDLFKVYKMANKNHFELYIYPNGKIESLRMKN